MCSLQPAFPYLEQDTPFLNEANIQSGSARQTKLQASWLSIPFSSLLRNKAFLQYPRPKSSINSSEILYKCNVKEHVIQKIKSWTICIMTQETNFHFLLRSNVQFHFLQCSSNSSRRLFWVYKDCLCFSRSRCHNLDGHNRLLSTHLCCLLRNHLYLFPYTTHFWCSKCNCLHKVLLHIFIMFK